MTTVLVATATGCQVFKASGESDIELRDEHVIALANHTDGSCLALIREREIWQRDISGHWSMLTTATLSLQTILSVNGRIYGGTMTGAHMVQVQDNKTETLPGFDHVEGRDQWFGEGPPLHIRSLTATSDEKTILAAVHVGGIPRSIDGGRTWSPSLPIKYDVHEVRAHPSLPNVVAAAAGVGLCMSYDGGKTWSLHKEGLDLVDSLSVAVLEDQVLFSIQDGPFAKRSQIWRRPIAGGALEQVGGGLPEWLEGKVDTGHLAARNGRAYVLDQGGNLWLSTSGSRGWKLLASDISHGFAVLCI